MIIHPDATTDQGPRQPENDIDVFLEPVIDELVEMFKKGVPDVWDEYKKEHVMIKGVLIATITDLSGRGSLSGEKTKGYTGCVECLDDTDAVNLSNNSKIVYTRHRSLYTTSTSTWLLCS